MILRCGQAFQVLDLIIKQPIELLAGRVPNILLVLLVG